MIKKYTKTLVAFSWLCISGACAVEQTFVSIIVPVKGPMFSHCTYSFIEPECVVRFSSYQHPEEIARKTLKVLNEIHSIRTIAIDGSEKTPLYAKLALEYFYLSVSSHNYACRKEGAARKLLDEKRLLDNEGKVKQEIVNAFKIFKLSFDFPKTNK
ncbi:MAG: hypothetical protein WC707_00480 [Candidatus Babeliaceae bacterium]